MTMRKYIVTILRIFLRIRRLLVCSASSLGVGKSRKQRTRKCLVAVSVVLLTACCVFLMNLPGGGYGSGVIKIRSRYLSSKHQQQSIGNSKHQKVLSYSLFGRNALKIYKADIESVAKEAVTSSLYKAWNVRFYTDLQIPDAFVERIQSINPLVRFVDVSKLDTKEIFDEVSSSQFNGNSSSKDKNDEDRVDLRQVNGMVWRFHPMADPAVDIACSRDLDSSLYKREEAAVREFLVAPPEYLFHVMRDYPLHFSRVMGGMWCFRNELGRLLGKLLFATIIRKSARRAPDKGREAPKGHDQRILNDHVWPIVLHRAMVHDSYFCHWPPGGRPFPTRRNFTTEPFVGCPARPCDYVSDVKVFRCPLRCRPEQHKDWEYC